MVVAAIQQLEYFTNSTQSLTVERLSGDEGFNVVYYFANGG